MDKIDPAVAAVVEKEIDRIRDIITAHHGGVEIVEATPERLLLRLAGHCANCDLAPMTYGLVLERYIREAVPTIKEVRYTK